MSDREKETFTCENCNCTSKGYLVVQTNTRKEKAKKKINVKIEKRKENKNKRSLEKLERKCKQHNSDWKGLKGILFPWETDEITRYFSKGRREQGYYCIRSRFFIKEKQITYPVERAKPSRYIECLVCGHRTYLKDKEEI